NVGVLQAVVAAHGKLELFDRTIEIIVADLRLALLAGGGRFELFLEVDEDAHVVFEQLGGEADGINCFDGAVGPDFQRELVVIGDLAEASGLDAVITLAHRRMDGIDGNEAQAEIVFEILVGRDVATAALSMEESSTRRRALPMVVPNPRSKGCAQKRPYLSVSVSVSTERRLGFWKPFHNIFMFSFRPWGSRRHPQPPKVEVMRRTGL